MNVVLIGYRGTGKSTIGRLLAANLEYEFFDADELLEQRSQRTIRDIFATEGEPFFRDLEAELLVELLCGDNRVLALGGGAVLRDTNREAIKRSGNRTVWLQAAAVDLLARIESDSTTAQRRPNLTAGGGLAEIERMLAIRTPLYRDCAEFTIDTTNKAPEQIAAEVVALLKGTQLL